MYIGFRFPLDVRKNVECEWNINRNMSSCILISKLEQDLTKTKRFDEKFGQISTLFQSRCPVVLYYSSLTYCLILFVQFYFTCPDYYFGVAKSNSMVCVSSRAAVFWQKPAGSSTEYDSWGKTKLVKNRLNDVWKMNFVSFL